jgi:hypothetical protein
MNPHGPNHWDTPLPRWLLPLFVFTILMAAGLGAAVAFVTWPERPSASEPNRGYHLIDKPEFWSGTFFADHRRSSLLRERSRFRSSHSTIPASFRS